MQRKLRNRKIRSSRRQKRGYVEANSIVVIHMTGWPKSLRRGHPLVVLLGNGVERRSPDVSELVGLKLQIPVTVRIKRATTLSDPLTDSSQG
jgi:hypothetical protein